MNGQWIGRYQGSNSGLLVVDLDDCDTHFEGYVYAYDDNTNLLNTYASVKTTSKASAHHLHVPIFAIDPSNGMAVPWDSIAARYPNIVHGKSADVEIEYLGTDLKVSWKTDLGSSGSATIPKSKASAPSEYQPLEEVHSWEDFKEYVNTLAPRRFLFRGQNEILRLRTGFHRTGRADLNTFLNADVKVLHRHLSQRTKHIFNLDIPDQNGSFLSLIQHHGYPTPLLDWTYSPYVGAFFAYRNAANIKSDEGHGKVRIFVFDQDEWKNNFNQVAKLVAKPHFSFLEFIAIENERMVPQQSVSSVTNLDDIESYIRSKEKWEGQYLKVIDLPKVERQQVLRELTMMGITAGSLFPGIDGTCAEIKERFFRN